MAIKILFADDEEDLREVISDELTAEGFQVETALDGIDALNKIKSNSYDLILLDYKMPGKNGIEVLNQINVNGNLTRVVMLTAIDEMKIAIEAMKSGASDYILKPFNLEILINVIERVLAK